MYLTLSGVCTCGSPSLLTHLPQPCLCCRPLQPCLSPPIQSGIVSLCSVTAQTFLFHEFCQLFCLPFLIMGQEFCSVQFCVPNTWLTALHNMGNWINIGRMKWMNLEPKKKMRARKKWKTSGQMSKMFFLWPVGLERNTSFFFSNGISPLFPCLPLWLKLLLPSFKQG